MAKELYSSSPNKKGTISGENLKENGAMTKIHISETGNHRFCADS